MKTAIVIGGGIAGCSSAYSLAKRGVNVTLIERHAEIASEASGNPFVVLYPRLTGQDTALEHLNLEGYAYSLQLLQTLGFEQCQYQACGVIQLAIDHTQQARQASLVNKYAHHNTFQQLSAEQLTTIAGVKLTHSGLYFPDAGGVHMPALCRALVQLPNIHIVTNTQAVEIKQVAQGRWQVTSNATPIAEADIVIIANANDANTLSQSAHIPLTAIRGQLSALQATDATENLRTVLCGEGYISPAINNLHYLGATFTLDDHDAKVRAKDHISNLSLLKKMSATLYEQLHNNIVSGRVAWRSQTPDYLPASGQLLDTEALMTGKFYYNDSPNKLPWASGLYVNVGHGAKGFLSAPLCAEIIASHITADTATTIPNELLNALQPSRFILRKLGLKQLAQRLIAP